jgi:predicted nuclease of predicted toxin-antitoxin system
VAERIRSHFNEQIDPNIAAALRRHGVDVTTTIEAGLRSAGDLAQLEYAMTRSRVIVTDDADFLRLDASGIKHAGIAFCHLESISIREIIRGLILIYEVLTPEEMMGRVEFL